MSTLYRRVRLVAIWRRLKLTTRGARPMTTEWLGSQPADRPAPSAMVLAEDETLYT